MTYFVLVAGIVLKLRGVELGHQQTRALISVDAAQKAMLQQ